MTLLIALMLIDGFNLSWWWYPAVIVTWLWHIDFWSSMIEDKVRKYVLDLVTTRPSND
jgi:hypothetical protein